MVGTAPVVMVEVLPVISLNLIQVTRWHICFNTIEQLHVTSCPWVGVHPGGNQG